MTFIPAYLLSPLPPHCSIPSILDIHTILQRCLGAIHRCSGARAIHGCLRAIHGSPSVGRGHATWTLGVTMDTEQKRWVICLAPLCWSSLGPHINPTLDFSKLDLHRGKPLAVHRDGLAGRVQFYSGRGLCGILHHTNVACKEWQSEVWDLFHHSPCLCTRPWLTFVGSLGDTHSLAYELIVSSPSTPAHATWASKATMLTCRVGGCCGNPGIMFVPLMLCPQPGHLQISLYQLEPPKLVLTN